MKIVGCDLHTRYQQVAMLDGETGELVDAAQSTKVAKRGAFSNTPTRYQVVNRVWRVAGGKTRGA